MSDEATPSVRWHTREDSGLRIDRQQRWWHDDVRIEHPRIIEAFNRGLTVEPDGRFMLRLGNDWCFVQVEDCAFAVLAVDFSPAESRLSIRLTDRTAEWLDVETLSVDAEGVLVVQVKNRTTRARFSREAQFELASHAVIDGDRLSFQFGDTHFTTSLPAAAFTSA